jgi:hypothetical protein
MASCAAVTVAAFLALDAGIAAVSGAPWVAIMLAILACTAPFWRWLPLPADDDIEALIKATREKTPDYVPAEWTEEFNR